MNPVRTQKTNVICTDVEVSTRIQPITERRKVSGF